MDKPKQEIEIQVEVETRRTVIIGEKWIFHLPIETKKDVK